MSHLFQRPIWSPPALVLLVVTTVLAALSGCGGGAATVPVSGTVSLDGKPFPGAVVTFVPHAGTVGYGGQAQTDDQGNFTAHMQDGTTAEGKPGLLPGEYKVVVNKLVKPDGTVFVASEDEAPIDSNAREVVPAKYSDYQQTTLTANINGSTDALKFELKSGRRS